MGNAESWILVANADAATKKIDNGFSSAGHIVLFLNTKTKFATPLTWSSIKLEKM